MVYKFRLTEVKVIVAGMQTLAQTQSFSAVSAYYKKIVKQLHPDKNNHPQAKEAFQVVCEAYDQVRQRQAPSGPFNYSPYDA